MTRASWWMGVGFERRREERRVINEFSDSMNGKDIDFFMYSDMDFLIMDEFIFWAKYINFACLLYSSLLSIIIDVFEIFEDFDFPSF